MTKSTITKERLLEIIVTGPEASGAEQNELARMALAAMDSEPVAEVVSIYGDPEAFGEREIRPLVGIQQMPYGTKLYRHAQPAPVAPDELLKEYLRLVDCMLSDYRNGNYGDTQRWIRHIVEASDAFEEKHGLFPWEMARKNFRAAMLAAEPQSPGSDPATVPGKWIPVSERMPEAGGDMIVFTDGIVMSGVSYAKKKGFYIQALEYDDDEPVDSVTHWMPLPAAPQEVK
ncbi:TPA: DUF551 domain-containing protein [Klebsiella pneumoniae]|nr:DUF551 domain-containing protein [Klebsiella pneumoniae]